MNINLRNFVIGNDKPFTLIAGPCQMESKGHALYTAEILKRICDDLDIPMIYKSSFDKANRTSIHTQRGMGMDAALRVFEEIRKEMPVITDVHTAEQCAIVAEVVDVLQIPAFLCRQTDLLIAAGNTGKIINVKKGQFMAPWDMRSVVEKIGSTGNTNIMLCDRGTSFGYNTLVSDMRGLPQMATTGFPVVFDATHSTQQPGGQGDTSGGQREFAPVLARAAVAIGVAAVFIEAHENPDQAPSDGPNMIPLNEMKSVLEVLKQLDQIAKENPVKI